MIYRLKNLSIIRKIAMRVAAILMIVGILLGFVFLPITVHAAKGEDKVVRVGWYDSTYCYKDSFGRRAGIAYEYQQKIVAYTGWTYEYVEGTWPELLQKLMNGEIDMLSDVSYTKERAESILYPSVPMGTESYYIFIRDGNTEISLEDLSSFEGKLFAVDKGSVMEEFTKTWAESNGINIRLMEITDLSVDETITMLENGEIDAYVTVDSYGDRATSMSMREGCSAMQKKSRGMR